MKFNKTLTINLGIASLAILVIIASIGVPMLEIKPPPLIDLYQPSSVYSRCTPVSAVFDCGSEWSPNGNFRISAPFTEKSQRLAINKCREILLNELAQLGCYEFKKIDSTIEFSATLNFTASCQLDQFDKDQRKELYESNSPWWDNSRIESVIETQVFYKNGLKGGVGLNFASDYRWTAYSDDSSNEIPFTQRNPCISQYGVCTDPGDQMNADGKCIKPLNKFFKVDNVSNLSLGTTSDPVKAQAYSKAGITVVDQKYQAYFRTLSSQAEVDYFNNASICLSGAAGETPWAVGIPKDISSVIGNASARCDFVSVTPVGTTLYGISQRTTLPNYPGKQVLLQESKQSSGPLLRPMNLDVLHPFIEGNFSHPRL